MSLPRRLPHFDKRIQQTHKSLNIEDAKVVAEYSILIQAGKPWTCWHCPCIADSGFHELGEFLSLSPMR